MTGLVLTTTNEETQQYNTPETQKTNRSNLPLLTKQTKPGLVFTASGEEMELSLFLQPQSLQRASITKYQLQHHIFETAH